MTTKKAINKEAYRDGTVFVLAPKHAKFKSRTELWTFMKWRSLVFTTCTLNVSMNLSLPLQNGWLEEICTKGSRFMLTSCWTQKHWKICHCSLTWMVMSVSINTTNCCAVWAWTVIKTIFYWGYLKAIIVEQVRKSSCYLWERAPVTTHACNQTRKDLPWSCLLQHKLWHKGIGE